MSDSVRNSGWNLSGDQYRWCGCKCAIEFVSFETLKTHVPTSHTLTTLHKINIQFNASRAVRVKVQIYYYFRCRNGCWRSRSRRLTVGTRRRWWKTSLFAHLWSGSQQWVPEIVEKYCCQSRQQRLKKVWLSWLTIDWLRREIDFSWLFRSD